MAFGPSFEFGHALEAGFFIHARRLEVIARDPNPTNASTACLGDKRIQQCTCAPASSVGFIDPHLLQFGNACPRIAGGDADDPSGFVADDKAQAPAVVSSGHSTIVLVETAFDRVDLIRRKVMLRFDLEVHFTPKVWSARLAASLLNTQPIMPHPPARR